MNVKFCGTSAVRNNPIVFTPGTETVPRHSTCKSRHLLHSYLTSNDCKKGAIIALRCKEILAISLYNYLPVEKDFGCLTQYMMTCPLPWSCFSVETVILRFFEGRIEGMIHHGSFQSPVHIEEQSSKDQKTGPGFVYLSGGD